MPAIAVHLIVGEELEVEGGGSLVGLAAEAAGRREGAGGGGEQERYKDRDAGERHQKLNERERSRARSCCPVLRAHVVPVHLSNFIRV